MKKSIKTLLSLTLLFFGFNLTVNAGWLEVPGEIDAKGILNQYIIQYSPVGNSDYTGNLIKLGELFRKGSIYEGVKNEFYNAVLSNINYLLNTQFGVSYGWGKFNISEEEAKILKKLGLYDIISNLRFITFNYDFLKNIGLLNDDAYNYFKNKLYPIIKQSYGLEKPKKIGLFKSIKTYHINGYPALFVPKTFDNIKKVFKILLDKNIGINENIIIFEIPYKPTNGALILVYLPSNPKNLGDVGLLSNVALEKKQLSYLIKGKIKYPQDLDYCFKGIDGSTINNKSDLEKYMINKCNLYNIDIDCDNYSEFIGNFNEGTPNQYSAVFGLDEKDGFLYVIPIERFYSKRIVALLPSSLYNPSKQCGFNVLLQDRLSLRLGNQGTNRILYSSRNQGWPNSCSLWAVDGGIFKGEGSNDITNYCILGSLPNDFINKGNDLKIQYGLYLSGDVNNIRFFYGLADNNGNIINLNEAGKYFGQDNIGKGFLNKDISLYYNNGLWDNGVYKPIYYTTVHKIDINNNGNKDVKQIVENKLLWEWEIVSNNNANLLNSIIDSSFLKTIWNSTSYSVNDFNRNPKLFIYLSGANTDNAYIEYFDAGFNDYTRYLLYGLGALKDGTKKLTLRQVLDFGGYDIFFKDIGLDDYNNPDNTKGIFLTFSGQNNFFTFKTYTNTGAEQTVSSAIDIDALKIEFGKSKVGNYKRIDHLKYVYDQNQNLYVVKTADANPLSNVYIGGFNIGGIIGDLLKDCSLSNFVNNDLKECSHNKLLPLNVDNDYLNIDGVSYKKWPEWLYLSGTELRIFNNIVQKNNFGTYNIAIKELFYSNNLIYCKKLNQNVDYYSGHNSETNPLVVNMNNFEYKGYSPDNSLGISIVMKDTIGYKYVFILDGNNFFNKTYKLSQTIYDPDDNIKCE